MTKSLGPKTLLLPTPVLIIGSYDAQGRPNLMNAAWGGIASSQPPAISVSIRPARLTHENIMQSRAFTVNLPSVDFVREADYVGIYPGKEEDKFAATGLTAVKAEYVNAPLVKEFPMSIECRLLQTVELGVHTMFIGEIMDVKADEGVLDSEGNIDPRRVQPLSFSPCDGNYYKLGEVAAKAFSIGKK